MSGIPRAVSAVFLALAFFLAAAAPARAQTYFISTIAGGALPVNIPGTSASLYGPQSAIATDSAGNVFFVDGNTVLRLDAGTGTVTLVAGNGTSGYSGDNGPATSARLHQPNGIAVDSAGNLYIASFYDNVVREVTGGVINTIAGTGTAGYSGDNGPAASAQLSSPYAIALDSAGNLYIADYGNSRIREVSGGVITTIAGTGFAGFSGDNGPATGAQLNGPRGLFIDTTGILYVADTGNNRVRAISGGVITSVAGNGTPGFSGDNGTAVSAQLNAPCGVVVDSAGNIYIADYYNNRVRRVTGGIISTVAGIGTPGYSGDTGLATKAQLNEPLAIAIDSNGNLYIADYGNNVIRMVSSGVITTVAGNGTAGFSGDGGVATRAEMHAPYSVALDSSGNFYTADYQNHRVRWVSGGIVATVAGTGAVGFSGDGGPALSAQLSLPSAVVVDANGNLYIADSGNNRIRKVSGSVIATVAGNGTAGFSGDNGSPGSAQLNQPAGIALDSSGNLYIADSGNNRIRKVSGGLITTVAGSGTAGFGGDTGPALSAQLYQPSAVALDSAGNLYIADTLNNRIRKVSNGIVSTAAGNGSAGFSGDNALATSARLNAPAGVIAGSGTTIYIADTANNAIRKVSGGVITTIAGGGPALGDNGPAIGAGLAAPQGIAIDPIGNIYIADTLDNRVRLLTPVPLSVSAPSSLPQGTINVAYSAITFAAVGGSGTYTWSATGLPKGMTFSAAGVFGGTPTVAATSGIQFTVKDSAGTTAASTLSWTAALPVPAISNVSPVSATALGAAFTLTVTGTGYLTGATVQWNGSPLVTKVVSATQLTASVTASLIASPGSASVQVSSGGTSSNTVAFAINPPPPVLTSMSPASVTAQSPGFTLTVTGTGFLQTSQVQWNGAGLSTTFVSATQLMAPVSASLVASAGSASVVVASGAASSAALTFSINPLPAIASLSPVSVTSSGPAFTLTVTGTGFLAGNVVTWNNSPLVTKFVSVTQLTASVPATLIANPGSATILVTSGATFSNTSAFSVNPPTPSIKTLSPASATATAAGFTLTVTGTGFVQSSQIQSPVQSTIQWNGSALPTTFVSATQLTASVDIALIASAGTASVTVVSGQAASSALTFTINPAPAITSLSPASATAYGPAFTLTINGTDLVSGATAQWNNTPLVTKSVSATQMTASVPASLIGGAGSISIVVLSGGVVTNSLQFSINPAPPVIASLSPASAVATGSAFTLTVNGTGFGQTSTVQWAGSALPTSYVSPTQVTAFISANLIASAGSAGIVVANGGTSSAALNFPINAPPAITSLNPAAASAGGIGFTLAATGTGFVQGVQIQWNGAALPTTFVSATQVTAPVSASLIASAGSVNVVASYGGASSNGITFSINGPPTISGLSPSAAAAGGAAFTLTINGTGFVSGATANWNGTPLTTKFVSATQLTASVPASLIATGGVATIVVNSGGSSSQGSQLPINPPPAITSLSPSSVAGTGAAFTLTVNGNAFVSGAAVQWNGTALATTFVAATQLTAAVPANLAAGIGSASIVAVNPGPTSSAAVKISITAVLPIIPQGGVVPIYSAVPVIQPGSWVSIYGTGLAAATSVWKGDFPTTLGGTKVTIDNKPAYLWLVSPTQINLQAPNDTATGIVNVVVTTASGSATSTVTLAPYGPSFSLLPGGNYAAGVILTPDGSGNYGGGSYDLAGPAGAFTFKTRPVKPGEILEIYGVGFGPTSPVVPAGKTYTGSAAPTANIVTVTIGGIAAKVLFSGITLSGVYQFNLVVPGVGSGDQPLLASVGGVQSPSNVLITIQ